MSGRGIITLKLVFAWTVLWTCCTFTGTQSELCEGITANPCMPGKLYPDADNCTTYYECDAGIQFTHHACSASTPFFNIDSEKCEIQGSHDCAYRCVTPSPTVPTSSTTTSNPSPTVPTSSTTISNPPPTVTTSSTTISTLSTTAPAGSSIAPSSIASSSTLTMFQSTPSGTPTTSTVAGSMTDPLASATVSMSPASSITTPATTSTARAPATTTSTAPTSTTQAPVQTHRPNGAGQTGASFVVLAAAVTLARWTPIAARA